MAGPVKRQKRASFVPRFESLEGREMLHASFAGPGFDPPPPARVFSPEQGRPGEFRNGPPPGGDRFDRGPGGAILIVIRMQAPVPAEAVSVPREVTVRGPAVEAPVQLLSRTAAPTVAAAAGAAALRTALASVPRADAAVGPVARGRDWLTAASPLFAAESLRLREDAAPAIAVPLPASPPPVQSSVPSTSEGNETSASESVPTPAPSPLLALITGGFELGPLLFEPIRQAWRAVENEIDHGTSAPWLWIGVSSWLLAATLAYEAARQPRAAGLPPAWRYGTLPEDDEV